MPANLRPRVQEFDPFRRVEPSRVAGSLDTYARPVVDDSAERGTAQIVAALGGLVPSLNRYADRQFRFEQEQLAAQAQGAVADMTPEQIRRESELEWETISKERGIDNPWWKIRLDEAAGRRLGLEFGEQLTSRMLEASNPDDPNAHLRVLEEERARATAGMNDVQWAQFESFAEGVQEKFVLTAATNREQRYQAQVAQQFRDDVRGLVREALDPALGGAVDLTALRAVVESERRRSGNDGRAELLAAIQDTITVEAAKAGNDAELDALRVQAAALLGEIAGETFGDERTFGENESQRLDAADVLLERVIRDREDNLRERLETREKDAADEMDDLNLGLAAQVFDGRLTPQEAEEQMLEKAQEIAARDGVSPDYLIGRGRQTLASQSAAVEETRFAALDDPDVVKSLRDALIGPDYNPVAFAEMLRGAAADRKISRGTYGTLIGEAADARKRQVLASAAAPVDALTKSMGERVREAAATLLESIPDEAQRDDVEARLLAKVDEVMTSERGRLTGMIEARGLDQATAAIDAWTPDFLNRSGGLVSEILREVSDDLPLGSLDKPRAFRDRLRADPIFRMARERWIYDYVRARLDDDSAVAIGAPGQDDFLPNVNDVAAYVATGRANATSGLALRLYDQAEEALFQDLEQRTEIGKPEVAVRDALRVADGFLRAGSFQVPQPEVAPKRAGTVGAGESKAQVVAAAGESAGSVSGAVDRLATAQARVEALREGGFPEEIQRGAAEELAKAEQEMRRYQETAYAEHQRVIARVGQGLRPDIGKPLYGGLARVQPFDPITNPDAAGEALEIRNGRLHLSRPPTKSRATYLGFGPIKRTVDAARYEALLSEIEGQFVAAKMYLGLTLDEVKAGKGKPTPDATPDQWISLDRRLITPASVPFFGSLAELEGADLTEWLALFPSYSREMFLAAQRQVILERIPQQTQQ